MSELDRLRADLADAEARRDANVQRRRELLEEISAIEVQLASLPQRLRDARAELAEVEDDQALTNRRRAELQRDVGTTEFHEQHLAERAKNPCEVCGAAAVVQHGEHVDDPSVPTVIHYFCAEHRGRK